MSEAQTPDEEQRRLAPGIARAMRDVRNATALTSPAHRRRWSLPSGEPNSEPEVDEQR